VDRGIRSERQSLVIASRLTDDSQQHIHVHPREPQPHTPTTITTTQTWKKEKKKTQEKYGGKYGKISRTQKYEVAFRK
jgi:diadenosine tetraphosphate (Ap4A) HIT family hydrolase